MKAFRPCMASLMNRGAGFFAIFSWESPSFSLHPCFCDAVPPWEGSSPAENITGEGTATGKGDKGGAGNAWL